MTSGETSSTFKSPAKMSDEETKSFDRWLINNAVIGSVFAAGIVAIVLIGPSQRSVPAGIQKAAVTEFSAVAKAD